MARNKVKILSSLVVFVAVIIWLHYNIVEMHTIDLQKKSTQRIELYQNSLHNELTRFNFLPFVIARDKQLIDWSFKRLEKANIALEKIKKASGANEVYIMDDSGKTLSASNWREDSSFVDKNFMFRPYFKEAMAGKNGQFFGIGTTSKKPGFYISTGVKENNKIVAVTVAKVDLSVLENIWVNAGENIFVTNADDIIILSSKKEWKYQTLGPPLKESRLEDIKTKKQFSNQIIKPLSGNVQTPEGELYIDNIGYLHQQEKIKDSDWVVHYLTPSSDVRGLVLSSWIKIGLIMLMVTTFALIAWSFQSREKLKSSLKESAKLIELNDLLKAEINQRKEIEKELRVAQKNIKRASKLAAMGELSASIVHELGQPLSAMKTYIASAQLPSRDDKELKGYEYTILPKLDALVERMSKISQQLKFFSNDNKKELTKIDIRDAIKGALIVVSPALEKDNVALLLEFKDQPYIIEADQTRIEQVFINLINNARVAVEHANIKQITITIGIQEQTFIIDVKDTGEGIMEDALNTLFDPFYTNRSSGTGLGLGLTICANIVHEFNGTITAYNNDNVGSTFSVTLPICT